MKLICRDAFRCQEGSHTVDFSWVLGVSRELRCSGNLRMNKGEISIEGAAGWR
jgi:hypothetical protein